MPTTDAIERFVSLVESGRGLDAISGFYAEHASMQENFAAPRVGKAALLAHERAAQAGVTDLKSTCIRPVLVSGDTVVIRWCFEYRSGAGKTTRFEELAWQRWAGDLIVEEQFFYDPAQFK